MSLPVSLSVKNLPFCRAVTNAAQSAPGADNGGEDHGQGVRHWRLRSSDRILTGQLGLGLLVLVEHHAQRGDEWQSLPRRAEPFVGVRRG